MAAPSAHTCVSPHQHNQPHARTRVSPHTHATPTPPNQPTPDPTAPETRSGPKEQGINRPLLCRLLAWELERELHRMFHVSVPTAGGGGATTLRQKLDEGYRKKFASLKVIISACVWREGGRDRSLDQRIGDLPSTHTKTN